MTDEVHAIVLSGGGGHGAYEVGVMEVLFGDRAAHVAGPLDAAVFTGTSVGSYNAAVMVAESGSRRRDGADGCVHAVRELRRCWLEECAEIPGTKPNGAFRLRADPRGLYHAVGRPAKLLAALRETAQDARFVAWDWTKRSLNAVFERNSLFERSLELFDLSYVISTAPLERLIRDTVNLERLCDREARALRIAATDWDHGQTVVFSNKPPSPEERRDMKEEREGTYRCETFTVDNGASAILASTAIPAIFPAIRLDETNYVDGVVLMNTPLRPAIQCGATVLHVIYLDPELELVPEGHLSSTIDTVSRMMVVALGQAIKADIEHVKRVNRRIALARELREDLAKPRRETRKFIREFADQQEVTIHRYFPSRDIGGVLGMLNFQHDRMVELIELGFHDAVTHDCAKCGCELP